MKRDFLIMSILLIVMAVSTVGASAQNANRKGWIVELQGGRLFGTVDETENFSYNKDNGMPAYRRTGGFCGALNFGYRWATSQFCAVEIKLHAEDNFSATEMLKIGVMPGFRYTTHELFGNTSMYLGGNVGIAFSPSADVDGIFIIPEANVGFNFGNLFSMGVFLAYNLPLDGTYYTDKFVPLGVFKDYYTDLKSNTVAGLKFGLRF